MGLEGAPLIFSFFIFLTFYKNRTKIHQIDRYTVLGPEDSGGSTGLSSRYDGTTLFTLRKAPVVVLFFSCFRGLTATTLILFKNSGRQCVHDQCFFGGRVDFFLIGVNFCCLRAVVIFSFASPVFTQERCSVHGESSFFVSMVIRSPL